MKMVTVTSSTLLVVVLFVHPLERFAEAWCCSLKRPRCVSSRGWQQVGGSGGCRQAGGGLGVATRGDPRLLADVHPQGDARAVKYSESSSDSSRLGLVDVEPRVPDPSTERKPPRVYGIRHALHHCLLKTHLQNCPDGRPALACRWSSSRTRSSS